MGFPLYFILKILFFKVFFFNGFMYFWSCAACGIIVSWSEIKPAHPVLEAWSLDHWTTGKGLHYTWNLKSEAGSTSAPGFYELTSDLFPPPSLWSLCFSCNGLLSVSRTGQARFYPRPFTHAIYSDFTDYASSSLGSQLRYHLLQKDSSDYPT